MSLSERVASYWKPGELRPYSRESLSAFSLPESALCFLDATGLPAFRTRVHWSFRFPHSEREPERVVHQGCGFVILGGSDHYGVGLQEPTGEVFVVPRDSGAGCEPQYANAGIGEFAVFLTLYSEHLNRVTESNYDKSTARASADAMMSEMNSIDPTALARRTDFWRVYLTS